MVDFEARTVIARMYLEKHAQNAEIWFMIDKARKVPDRDSMDHFIWARASPVRRSAYTKSAIPSNDPIVSYIVTGYVAIVEPQRYFEVVGYRSQNENDQRFLRAEYDEALICLNALRQMYPGKVF